MVVPETESEAAAAIRQKVDDLNALLGIAADGFRLEVDLESTVIMRLGGVERRVYTPRIRKAL